MDIATGAMNILLPKLGELLLDEYRLRKGTKKEIEELQKELTSMRSALRKVSEVPRDELDEQVIIWARDVRELSYDINDAIDIFAVRCQGQKSAQPLRFKVFLDRTTNLFRKGMNRHQITKEIKDIKSLVKEASERRDRYRVDDVASKLGKVTVDPRLDGIYRKATDLVSIEEPKNEVAKRLMREDGSSRLPLNVVSIVGFGGLGKTTLANALLHEHKANFDCSFFISVSLKPDITKIFKNILSQLDRNASTNEEWGEKQLIDEIRRILGNKRCLCVIDDIWEESAWDTIKHALQDGVPGSKLITTTRKRVVGERIGGYVYELKPLTDDASKRLFNKRIFGSEDGCPPDLSKVAEKILKKCGGVPLAIITMASMLASKPRQLVEWEKLSKSIGTGLGHSFDVDKMRKILSLSYYDLPPHLKTCLLYLSKYPEDKKIRKDVLIWSWIAEGFILEETRGLMANLEEIGESNFNELINRSMIQPVHIGSIDEQDGQVHACQVHDMVHELINQLSDEEGFVTTLPSDVNEEGMLVLMAQRKIRRLSIHNTKGSNIAQLFAFPEASHQLSHLSSVTVFSHANFMPPPSNFRVLRVLQLECWRCPLMNNFLKDLCGLHHLRFLRIWKGRINKLPESIGNLQFLETLDIRSADAGLCIQLPYSFPKLGRLVRLIADRARLPDGVALGCMKCLRELVGIDANISTLHEIGSLTGLRILHIQFQSNGETDIDKLFEDDIDSSLEEDVQRSYEEAFINCLQRCSNLQALKVRQVLTSSGFSSLDFIKEVPSGLQSFMSTCYYFHAFPAWINSSLSCLATLSIKLVMGMKQEYLVTLGKLPSLLFLKIIVYGDTDQKERLIVDSGTSAFRCLQDFHFDCDEMCLMFQPRAMQELQRLCLCFKETRTFKFYGGFDFGLENLPSLRRVLLDTSNEPSQEAEAAIRKALDNNPNHPSLDIVDISKWVPED